MKQFKIFLCTLVVMLLCICCKQTTSYAAGFDKIPPKIGTVRIINSEVYAPGWITIEFSDIVEEGSGITSFGVSIIGLDPTTGKGVGRITENWDTSATPYFTNNTYTAKLKIPSDVTTGIYQISNVTVKDARENYCYYVYNTTDNGDHTVVYDLNDKSNYCKLYGKAQVYGKTFDLDLSISNPYISKNLREMPDGKVANIFFDSTGKTIITKDIFESIKNTNKKILISSGEGIEWIFNGKDIHNTTKNVDCQVNITPVDGEKYGATNQKLLKLNFASNGTLPGEATIRVKSDYFYKMYNLSQKLYLYYMNKSTLQLEDYPEYILDGSDHWCEFKVDHNSTFLLSGKKLQSSPAPKPYVKLNTSSLVMQVKQSSSALKVTSKLKTDKVKKWTSSKSSVVSVNSKSGKLKAKKPGTSYITVQLNSGVKAKCKIKVQRSAVRTKSITVGNTKVRLKKGKTYTIHVTRKPLTANDGKVTFKSSKSKIVTVNSKGKLKAKKKGKATITVKAGKKVKRITVTVK